MYSVSVSPLIFRDSQLRVVVNTESSNGPSRVILSGSGSGGFIGGGGSVCRES